MKQKSEERQLMALVFVASLAPAIRLMPDFCADKGGGLGFLAPLIALPVLIVYVCILSAFLSMRNEGEGLGELIVRLSGRGLGSAVLILGSAFLLFSCGFILRSGAERFVSTVYPTANELPFAIVMLVIGTLAALGKPEALLRSAKIFSSVLLFVLAVLLLFSLPDIKFDLIKPKESVDIGGLVLAAVPTAEIYSGIFAYAAVFETGGEKPPRRALRYSVFAAAVCLLLALLCLASIGSYGAPLVSRLSHPFFTLIRNITIFRTFEHIEALVVTMWVLPDFIIFALMLSAAIRFWGLVLPGSKLFENKRVGGLICAAVAAGAMLLIPGDADSLRRFSELIVPLANIAVVWVLFPLCFAVAAIKRRRSA